MTLSYETDEYYDYLEWEKKQWSYAFYRAVFRHCRSKRRCDCGHWVDGSKQNTEVYRYQVWRLNRDPRGKITQRTDCELCARQDNNEA